MKKLIAILICFITLKSFGQFPINATNGTPTTTVLTRGMSASDSGYWFRTAFPDTVSANYGRIEEIGGVMVRTIDGSIWLRNNAETKWIKLGDLTPITGCNALLQGGVVTYAGSGLVFDVSPATYIINCGGPYQSPQTQVTLAAADPSNPRFDVIYADVNGVVGVITGTAAATPSAPQVDPTTQIQLTFIRVDAGSTTPPLVTTETIYDENLSTPSEWATTATGVSVDYNNTTAPFHLTKAGSTGAIAQGNNLTFTNNVDVTLTDYTALKFYIRLKATFVQATQLNLSWYEGGVRVSTGVVVSHNNYGFDRTIVGSYQVITIPISAWAASLTESTVDQLIINITGSNASGFYIDWIQLQAGIPGGGSTTIPTFQQTLIAGSTMTQNNTILLNGTNLQIEDAATGYYVHMKPSLGRFEFFAQSGSGATYRSVGLDGTPDDIFMQATDTDGNTYLVGSGVGGTVDGTGVLLQVSKSGALSMINIKADSVVFKFHKGQWNADTVRAGTTTNTLLGWTNGTADNGKIGYLTLGAGLSITSGVLNTSGTVATPISSLTAAVGTNDINNGTLLQEWRWNTLSGNTGLKLSSTSALAASNAQKLFEVAISGANVNSGQQTFAGYFSNVHTGTLSDNVAVGAVASGGTTNVGVYSAVTGAATSNTAGYFTATGATDNYAIIVPSSSGSVGIGTATPTSLLHIVGTTTTGIVSVIQANSISSGKGLSISSSSTAAVSNGQTLLDVNLSGANSNSTETTKAASFINQHTGTSSTNIAGYFSASGGSNNYAILVPPSSGNVGIGLNTPNNSKLVVQGAGEAYAAEIANSSNHGLYANTTDGSAILAQSVGATETLNVIQIPSSTNIVNVVGVFSRTTTGTAANGIGGSIDLYSETDGGTNRFSNQIIWKWVTAADATRTSQLLLTGVNSAATGDIISFEGNKRTMLYGRLETQQGADVASVAGAIAVGLDGNVFELTGTNAVTLISNLNWVNGSEITFVFTSTATLTDGTANSGTDIGMELAGNTNFVGSADDVITLVLTEMGGTQRWREKSRSVN